MIFEIVFENMYGEIEIITREYLHCHNIDEAKEYANGRLALWFGQETRVDEDVAWDEFDCQAASLCSITEFPYFLVSDINGIIHVYDLIEQSPSKLGKQFDYCLVKNENKV